jgi:hypothetical protein
MNILEVVKNNRALSAMAPTVGKAVLMGKTYSPELFIVGAIGTGLYAGYQFAKAYSKHDEVLGDILEEVTLEQNKRSDSKNDVALTDKEMLALYGDVAKESLRLYGPALVLATVSVGLILKGHGILKGRNQGLMAALVVVEKGFNDYRSRVVDEHGPDSDKRYLYGASTQEIVTKGVDANGKKFKSKELLNTIPEDYTPGMYARLFDEKSPEFGPDGSMNLAYLQTIERWMNDQLILKGFVMLNDVYEAMHFKRESYGQVVGWSLSAKGDNFIDFGLGGGINDNVGDPRFLLDFNVNGVVFEYIE